MSISNVSSQHAGVYWCGVKSNEGNYKTSLRKIQLEIKSITSFKRSPTSGQNFTYWCEYPQGAPIKKFMCKGEDPSICQPLWNTSKFSVEDDTKTRNITITVRNVTTDDAGTYWCGAENTDNKRSNPFFNRLEMTVGCEASSEVKGCEGGWVELTCKYPREDQEYQKIEVINPRGKNIQITENDVWEENGGFSLYHDTRNKNLRMAIKQLKSDDFGKYNCKFYPRPHSSPETQKLELKVVKDGCQTPFNQTAYRTAKTTITCDFPKKYSYVKFICKDNNEICEEILSTQSSVKSNGTFTLTDTNSFNMSISNVSSQHAGVYWCGVKSNEGSYRASLRKIQLQVKNITIFKRSSTIGQTFTYWCYYTQGAPIKKFICKGEDPSICQPLWSTSNKKAGKFSVEDVKKRGNVTITIRDLTINDAGTYWCGAENTDNRHSNPFFNRLEMTVVPRTRSSADRNAIIITVICVAVLLLVLILVLVYTRCSKYKTNEEGLDNAEDFIYEEIEEQPHKPDSGTALKTIYVSAKHPTNPSAFTHYSNINHPNSSGEVSGDTSSTVKDNGQYSTVNHPSGFSENPLYSTVNKPQEH
ncbi:polymeric immunoglobulin receptor-like isoform X2 [Thunnus thynnus]|uniref:polymeric immunoglobulin receptor-like isoform X2 n=1 Tax=Thunnus thynnus TaxID=8237 RepID=UPI0035298173